MNIAVDSFPLTVKKASGIPNYLKYVLLNLIEIDRDNKYFLYCRIPFLFPQAKNLTFRFSLNASENSTSYGNALWLFSKGLQLMKKDKIDIFWGTRHMIPPLLPKKIKKVLTVYDLVWHYFPESMSRYNLTVMRLLADRSIKASDHIITVSNTTARSIMDIFNIPKERISVIYGAADQYRPLDKNDSAEYISEKYGTSKNYILTVSTIEPRKNLRTLLKVFANMKNRDLQLLIAGESGWKTSPVYKEYKNLGLTERKVKFLGYVPDKDMNKLYSGALIFVFPSIYEGFGIPPLEAMVCGTPIIASNASSLPEVIGDAGMLIDPDDLNSWVEGVIGVVNDETKREDMRKKGLERARQFSWRKAAEETLKIFQSIF